MSSTAKLDRQLERKLLSATSSQNEHLKLPATITFAPPPIGKGLIHNCLNCLIFAPVALQFPFALDLLRTKTHEHQNSQYTIIIVKLKSKRAHLIACKTQRTFHDYWTRGQLFCHIAKSIRSSPKHLSNVDYDF